MKKRSLLSPQRRADALVAIAEHYLASGSDGSQGLSSLKGAERCQLVLHVRAGSSLDSDAANLDGRWLIPNAARRLACDASLLVVQEDEVGNVLDIGRKTRIIPPAMARALAIRDGACQFPGCCENRYTEGHHIKHWADGGETKLDNLVTLCRYHHRELHKGTFFLSLKPETQNSVRFVERLCFSKVDRYFDAPFNRSKDFVIAANPAKFTCACCDDSALEASALEKAVPRTIFHAIDKNTAVTKWAGEAMDLGMAIDGLLNTGKRWKMDLISYTAARRNLAKVMDQVCNDSAPVVITHKGKGSVVMMSLEEYQAMAETDYLLRSRSNALNLLESITELEE